MPYTIQNVADARQEFRKAIFFVRLPPVSKEYFDERVCLFVRVFVCLYLRNHTSDLHRFGACCYLRLGTPLAALRYVMYFRFRG